MPRNVKTNLEFKRAKSAKERQAIAQGMREFWKTQPKGATGDVDSADSSNKKKLAIGVVTAATTIGALGYAAKKGKIGTKLKARGTQLVKQLDDKIEQEAFKGTFAKVAGLPTEQKNAVGRFIDARLEAAVKGGKLGVKEGAKQRVATEGSRVVSSVENKAKETADYVLNTPQRTADAFHEGFNAKPDPNSRTTRLGKWIAKKGKEDIATAKRIIKNDTEWRKRILGFSDTRNEFWIEFSKRKTKAAPKSPAKKQLSAEHRAAISKGLQDYYSSIPQKQETNSDKLEKVTRSVLRVAKAGKTAAEAGSVGYGLYKAITSKPAKKTLLDGISQGADIISSLSGSVANIGRGANSAANAGNAIHDITSGSKRKQQKLKERALEIKEKADKTNRQVHSVRAKLERRRAKQRDLEISQKGFTGRKYGIIADTSKRSNSPGGTKYEEMRTRRAKVLKDANDEMRKYLG